MKNHVKIIECPRDAMQGIKEFIPTELKVKYLNNLLNVGFDTIDFGSFVSPKAIPQLKDTAEVLKGLKLEKSASTLLAIVANERGAYDACEFEEIGFLGYPFSVSETFQMRNTNATIEESLSRVEAIQELALKNKKGLVVYLSMAFGNPYGDKWHPDVVAKWTERLVKDLEIKIIAPSDTIGSSNSENISGVFKTLISEFPTIEFGAHLHTTPDTWREKMESAYQAGCRRFDGAIKGFGGCPMAKDELTGNMPTEKMVDYFTELNLDLGIYTRAFNESLLASEEVFMSYH